MENKGEDIGSVSIEIGKKIPLNTLMMVVIQTIVIIISITTVLMSKSEKIDSLAADQAEIKTQMQDIRNEVLTKSEAANQFNFINEQNRRQDQDIRDIQNDIKVINKK